MSMLMCPGCNRLIDTDEELAEVGVLSDEVVCESCAQEEEARFEDRLDGEQPL